jgi:AcrR family transcriptional regulator
LKAEGISALTTNRVAERAGVSIGSLYQYFPNRDAIFLALAVANAEHKHAGLVGTLAACAGEPIGVAIERALLEVASWRGGDPKLELEIAGYLPRVADQSEVLAFTDRSITGVLEAFLRARADELDLDDPAAAAFLLVHTVQPLAQRIHLLSAHDTAHAARVRAELRTMIARYLTKRPQPSSATPF